VHTRDADPRGVKGRLSVLLVAGLILACGSFGAASYALSRAPRTLDIKNTASWDVITPARWSALQGSLTRKGFDPKTVHVVTAAPPLALVSATPRSGSSCLIVTNDGLMGATVCGSPTRLVTFATPGHFDQHLSNGTTQRVGTTNIVGIVPSGVVSVQQEWTTNGRASKMYASLLSAPQARVFGETLVSAGRLVLTARTSSGAVVARKTIRALAR
jgi:hypothetical protein